MAEIPRSYTLVMERGTTIGGIVRDEEGRPLEGATVTLHDDSPEDRGREALDFDGIDPRTDAQGRWHCDLIPAGLDLSHLHFTFSHSGFVSHRDAINNLPILTPQQLRARSGVVVLHKGLPVVGRVLNREGRPIAGASVRLGSPSIRLSGRYSTTRTDVEGRFRIGDTEPGEAWLAVQAAGHAPELVSVKVGPGLAPVELRLGPGHTIRGRVIDDRGRPVAGAVVAAAQWRGHQALDWRSETDAAGRFRWDDAPGDAVSLSAYKRGYDGMRRSAGPSGEEVVLSLVPGRELLVRGTVTDAETGRPIETFTVVPGSEIAGGPTLWIVGSARVHHGGRFAYPLSYLSANPHRVRIEAVGYLPATSAIYPNNAGDKVFDVQLRKGEWVAGVVRGPDGEPLAGAEVIVVSGRGINIDGGKAYQREYHPHVLTASDGRFSLSPPGDPYRIIALHDRGYAELSGRQPAESHVLTVEPWGRIEGILRVGGKPRAHETVVASLDDERDGPEGLQIQNASRAQTDEDGRFVIERVTPGEARVHWQPQRQGARTDLDRYYQPVFRDLLPGQTARMDLAQEGGRPLVGRVVRPDAVGQPFVPKNGDAYLIPKPLEVPYPPGLAEADRREWLRRWRFTEAARTYRQHRRGFGHTVKLQPDGSFRVDDLQPGDYELHVRVPGHADLIREVVATPPAAGQDAGPVDLGTLKLEKSGSPDSGR